MLTQELIKELLDYNAETGKLTWKARPRSMFTRGQDHTRWNNRFSGKEAGTLSDGGYLVVRLYGKGHKSHRIIWLYVHGALPEEIDHTNHIKHDNRLVNLRGVTKQINQMNQLIAKNNTSGQIGVHFDNVCNMWRSRIAYKNHRYNLGKCSNFQSACILRRRAEQILGFHSNHGLTL
jgi:hypothetical protein